MLENISAFKSPGEGGGDMKEMKHSFEIKNNLATHGLSETAAAAHETTSHNECVGGDVKQLSNAMKKLKGK